MDDSGFVERIESASGGTLKFASDKEGRITAIEEPSGQQTEFAYGADSEVAAVARNGARLCQIARSPDRSQCEVTFWDGSVTRAAYDLAGHPAQLVNRVGAVETLRYDSKGRLCEITNARGESTHFVLNPEGLPATTTHVDGRRESALAYDAMGNPSAIADNGELTFNATYAAPGVATAVSYANGDEYQFARDDKGRILEAEGPSSKTSFVYNDHGLPIEETTNGKTFRFEYDATDLLVALEYPDGSRVAFTYDEDKRVATCVDWQGGITYFAYEARDRAVTRYTPNQLTQYTALHSCGKPERIALLDAQSKVLADSQFAYDPQLRLTTRIDIGERYDYVYDAESQLLGIHARQQWLENYSYDPAGNRVASHWGSSVVASGNRVMRQGADSYDYDARGNVSAATVGNQSWRFEYDLRNQLVAAHGPSGTVHFAYDALGRRISKTSDTQQVEYIWCGEQLTQEVITTAEGVQTRDYLYMPSTYRPLAMRSGGKCYYFHTSHDGTPERISDASGQIVWAARYDAFGQAHVQLAKIDNPLRFAGQYYDGETGLHYNRFRYYSPRLGRYCSVDPLGLRADHNLYRYVGNDPVNRTDPLGLFWKEAASIALGCAVAAAIVLTAPVSLPALAVGALAVTAGVAVSVGMNEALSADHFCGVCLVRGFAKGAAFALGAMVAIALIPEEAAIVATALTAGLIVYGAYSTLNLVFEWDHMTHEQRMEAIGGVLGGVAVGLGVGFTGGPPTEPPPTGFRWAVTPEGEPMLVPSEEAVPVNPDGIPIISPMTGSGSGSSTPEAGGDPDAPAAEGEELGDDGLTPSQRKHFRDRIDNAPDEAAADQARFDRNALSREQRGLDEMPPEEWQRLNEQARANQSEGSVAQESALEDLGLEDNNAAGRRQSFPKGDDGAETIPDAVSDASMVDVKKAPNEMGPDGEPNTVFNSEQLRAQQDAARASGREPVTVVSNNNPAAVRPSGPLADNSTVLHHNPETGQFSEWNPLDNRWDPISNEAARSIVGGEPAPGAAPPP